MASAISTLLLRNLHDVFGEMDPERRRCVNEIFHEDAVFYEPKAAFTAVATRSIASLA
jgi:hypothetical protein